MGAGRWVVDQSWAAQVGGDVNITRVARGCARAVVTEAGSGSLTVDQRATAIERHTVEASKGGGDRQREHRESCAKLKRGCHTAVATGQVVDRMMMMMLTLAS